MPILATGALFCALMEGIGRGDIDNRGRGLGAEEVNEIASLALKPCPGIHEVDIGFELTGLRRSLAMLIALLLDEVHLPARGTDSLLVFCF